MENSLIVKGDFVRIREWDDMAEEFGFYPDGSEDTIEVTFCFITEMKPLCGLEFEVEKVDSDGEIIPTDYSIYPILWNWTIHTDMVVKV